MKRLFAALALASIHIGLRLAGGAEHTSMIAGMPISGTSMWLGPLYVVSYLAFVVLAPILALSGLADLATRLPRTWPPRPLRRTSMTWRNH